MSEFDDHLRAQGGACEKLAALFAYKRGMAESGFPCPPLSTTPWTDALNQILARIAELEARVSATEEDWKKRQDEARELLAKKDIHIEDCHRAVGRAEAELAVAIEIATMARQTFDDDGNGTRFLSEIRDDVIKDVKRLAAREKS